MACTVAGRRLARDGYSLHESLAALRQTVWSVCSREPEFSVTSALSVAWSEETLAHLHQVSCEDPMTGLASTAHLRARLSELYRGEVADRGVATEWALVVLDLDGGGDRLTRSLRLTRAGRAVRTVFNGSETVARTGNGRLLVLAGRDDRIGRRVSLVRRLVEVSCEGPVRAWMEGLPTTDDGAGLLLDELVRLAGMVAD
ncbi:MAG: hypothetical protein Q8Q02_08050 [Nocardioides sp.]|nr:hypothetical protein [Nocardioides sp.]